MNLYRTMLALFSILILAPCLMAQNFPRMEHRFEGLVADAFMADDGSKVWTAEDGGRVRFRDGTAPWVYLDTPDEVQDTIRAIHFLPHPNPLIGWNTGTLTGWIVGDNRKIFRTDDSGASWAFGSQVFDSTISSYTSHLRDIHFVRNPAFVDPVNNPTGLLGFLVGLHGVWRSTDGGSDWNQQNPVLLLDQNGNPITPADIELYAIDIHQCGNNEPVIIVGGEPGVIFRNVSDPTPANWGAVMQIVWDMRDESQTALGVCGSDSLYRGLHDSPPHRAEIWDVEFQRKCDGDPLLVIVAGGDFLLGSAFSSTDYGSTFVRECHECEVNPSLCAGNTDYELTSLHAHYRRHKEFSHLYGVAVFGDGSAVAAGYGGQHVVRRTDGVWEDRSQTSGWALEVTDQASLMALYGAVCQRNPGSSSSNGKAFLCGQGGQGRSTTAASATTSTPPNPPIPAGQPGENWTEDWTAGKQSGWWRIHATAFNTSQQGWRTGQNYHVAITTDGGLSWDLERVLPFGYHFAFHSIAIGPNATATTGSGVAVGQPDYRDLAMFPYGCTKPFLTQPKILRRRAVSGVIDWIEPTSITWLSSFGAPGKELRDVAWAETVGIDDVYWGCGTGETLLRSMNNGATWVQYPYPSGSAVSDFNALALIDQDMGFVVGKNISTGEACAYGIDASLTPPTKDISPSGGVVELFDVAFDAINNIAYAVGTVNTGSSIEGTLFSSTLNSAGFSTFVAIPGPGSPGVHPCFIGDFLGEPPLSSVAVATNGDLWVGGECGRVWRRDAGGWGEIKSQTDGHILDMASAPGGYVYVTSMRTNLTGPGLVRWKP